MSSGSCHLYYCSSPSIELTHLRHAIAVAIEAGGRVGEIGDGAVGGEGYGGVLFGRSFWW